MTPTTTALNVFKFTPNTQSKNHNSKNKKNSDETISTPRETSGGATTSPGVIQPQATATAEAENIRPPSSAEGTSPLNQDKDKDRDARAYERERQRAKHAGEWAKRLARKAIPQRTTGVGRPAVVGTIHAERRAKSLKGNVELDVDIDVYVLPQKRDMDRHVAKVLSSGLLKRASLPPSIGGADVKATQGVRVNLSDFVVQRKSHKRNVDDFEVIAPIRSVIALDDVDNVHDMDEDEPWEHIYASDDVAQLARPSYARVVGTGCK